MKFATVSLSCCVAQRWPSHHASLTTVCVGSHPAVSARLVSLLRHHKGLPRHTHNRVNVGFNVPLATLQVLLETSLSRQSIAQPKTRNQKTAYTLDAKEKQKKTALAKQRSQNASVTWTQLQTNL